MSTSETFNHSFLYVQAIAQEVCNKCMSDEKHFDRL